MRSVSPGGPLASADRVAGIEPLRITQQARCNDLAPYSRRGVGSLSSELAYEGPRSV